MRRSPAAAVAVLIVVGLATAWAFAAMIGDRFSTGEVYPHFSSFRTDPLGSKALYESLARLPRTACERNFKKLDKLAGATGQTLMLLNVAPESFSNSRDVTVGPITLVRGINGDAVLKFAAAGGRVIITLDGQQENWEKIQRAAKTRRKDTRARDAREKLEKKAKESKSKEGDEAKKEGESKQKSEADKKEGKENEEKDDEKEAEVDELLAMLRPIKSLRQALGMRVVKSEHLSGPEETPRPEPAADSPLDQESLPEWHSRATFGFADFDDEVDDEKTKEEAKGKKAESKVEPATSKERADAKPKRSSKDQWKVLALAGSGVVLAERRFSTGSIVVASDSYFASNEALMKEPASRFLAWLVGDARQVIFDETHLGTKEDPGIMHLVRKHHLHGLFVGGLILFGLFVWRSSLSLVPANGADEDASIAVSGHGATAGLVSLLKRGISRGQVLTKSFETWEKSAPRGHASMKSRIESARSLLPPPHVTRARAGVLTELYRRICEMLHPRRKSRP